jgi:hypothetical protein
MPPAVLRAHCSADDVPVCPVGVASGVGVVAGAVGVLDGVGVVDGFADGLAVGEGAGWAPGEPAWWHPATIASAAITTSERTHPDLSLSGSLRSLRMPTVCPPPGFLGVHAAATAAALPVPGVGALHARLARG